jgi:hypothetical protein
VPPPVTPSPDGRLNAWADGDRRLTVTATPDDAEIRVNGQRAGVGSTLLQVGPQRLRLEVAAQGYSSFGEDLDVRADSPAVDLRVALSSSRSGGLDPETRVRRRATGWVMTGVGVLGAVAGSVLLSVDGDVACSTGPASSCPDVYSTLPGGASLIGIGTAAIGTGIGLIVGAGD